MQVAEGEARPIAVSSDLISVDYEGLEGSRVLSVEGQYQPGKRR